MTSVLFLFPANRLIHKVHKACERVESCVFLITSLLNTTPISSSLVATQLLSVCRAGVLPLSAVPVPRRRPASLIPPCTQERDILGQTVGTPTTENGWPSL